MAAFRRAPLPEQGQGALAIGGPIADDQAPLLALSGQAAFSIPCAKLTLAILWRTFRRLGMADAYASMADAKMLGALAFDEIKS